MVGKKRISKELIIVAAIIIAAIFVRFYEIDKLLPFTFDQAEYYFYVKQIVGGKPILIGPRTGIEGFYLGPAYFYVLVPFYLAFGGHPIGGAVLDGIFGVLAVLGIYFLAKEMFGKRVGILALLISCFSPLLVSYSRYSWNPHPLVLLSVFFYHSLWKVLKGEERYFILAFFWFSLGLQMEVASAIFYLPTALIIFVLMKYKIKRIKYVLLGFLVMMVSFLPQIIFNLRHDFITIKAVFRFIGEKGQGSFFVLERFKEYGQVIEGVLVSGGMYLSLFIFLGGIIYLFREGSKKRAEVVIILSWLTVNFLLLFLFKDKAWDHHYISLFAGIIIGAGFFISKSMEDKKTKGLGIILVGMIVFSGVSSRFIGSDRERDFVVFEDQLKAIDYIYKDADGEDFNVYIYVPSVYDHPYQYIFSWYGEDKYGYLPRVEEEKELVYFIVEPDIQLPDRQLQWKLSHRVEGEEVANKEFGGGLVVEKRRRK